MTSKTSTKKTTKNGVPLLMYYDIFKNYYANTQEDNFYIIGNTEIQKSNLKRCRRQTLRDMV